MVLSTPIVLICSVGGIIIHHKLSAAKAKKPTFDLTDDSWMTEDSSPSSKNSPKKKQKIAQPSTSGCSTPAKKNASPAPEIGHSTEAVMVADGEQPTEVAEVEEKGEVEEVEEVKDMQEKTKAQKDKEKKKARKARKKAKNAEAKAEEKNEVEDEPSLEYTKGLPRNKMVSVTPLRAKEDLKLALMEIFQERILEQVLDGYKQDWKVVGKKARNKKAVVVGEARGNKMKEVAERKIDVEKQVEKEVEAEVVVGEDESSEALSHTTEEVSHTTKALTPPELQEMAREGRQQVEELLWFAEDEDFTGLLTA